MRFSIPDALLKQLRLFREEHLASVKFPMDLELQHDTFLLDPGMGPATFLTADGVVLIDKDESWNEPKVREATEDEAIGALIVGADKTGITGLLDLIPRRPQAALACPQCLGARIARYGNIGELVCFVCRGRGWATEKMLDDAMAKGHLHK